MKRSTLFPADLNRFRPSYLCDADCASRDQRPRSRRLILELLEDRAAPDSLADLFGVVSFSSLFGGIDRVRPPSIVDLPQVSAETTRTYENDDELFASTFGPTNDSDAYK